MARLTCSDPAWLQPFTDVIALSIRTIFTISASNRVVWDFLIFGIRPDEQNPRINANQSTLTIATRKFLQAVAVCIPLTMFLNAATAQHEPPAGATDQHEPSDGAKGMPGAKGTIEFKPSDSKRDVPTYWKGTDAINPECQGAISVSPRTANPTGVFFGEACENERILIESNPGVDVIHPHTNDLEYPDRFDCNAWRRCEESHSRRMQGGYGASALHYVDSLRMQVSRDHQPLADEGAGGPARSKILPRRDCIRDTKSWTKCKL